MISVVIPAHDAAATLGECLRALEAGEGFGRWCREVLVVDDGSKDDTAEIAARHGARVVRLDSAHGPAAARNRGAFQARGEILLFLDADVRPHFDTLVRVARHFESSDGPDAVIGSYDDRPPWPSVVSVYRNLLHHWVHQNSSADALTFWAGCGAIRRSVFLEIGGFDESFTQPSIEDIELGYRLTDAGFRIRLDHELQVTHMKRWTLRGMIVTDVTRRAVPWARLLLARRSVPRDLNLRLRHRFSGLLAFVLVAALFAGTGLLAAGQRSAGLAAVTVTLVAMASLLVLNASLYAFFCRKRGVLFAVCGVALHWLYYLYSGAALAWVLVTRGWRR